MKRLSWWMAIAVLLISQTYAASLNDAKTQERESDLKQDAKELIKAAATSAEYSASLANDYQTEKQQDNVASSSSSVSTVESSSNYNNAPSDNQQYSQPLSYSQPGTPVQPIHSYSQPLNYPSQALPYTAESQQVSSSQYGGSSQYGNSADANSQYGSLKDVQMQEIPNANSQQYYPQYPAPQQYNPHLVLQQQASAPVSDYHQPSQSQYESNQATYVQPIQHQQNVYLHHQHHVSIPGSSYSEQSYVVDNGDKQAYPQANSYSQPLPPEYSPEYSNNQPAPVSSSNVQVKPKKTVILAIPVKLVAKNKYSGQNNGASYTAINTASSAEVPQSHYSTNVVPAAANLPVAHSIEKNNYNNDYEKPSFNEKPLYADKPNYTDKTEEYPKVNHNLNNNLNNGGYQGGEYESSEGDNYGRGNQEHGRYNNNGPQYKPEYKPQYNPGREVKPLSNYQSNRPRRPTNYGPEISEYSGPSGHVNEEISVGPEHIQPGYPSIGEIEHNHIHTLPHHSIPHHKHHKLNEIYETVDHVPPYIPSDFPSLGGSIGGMSGLSGLGYSNPMELIYSSPYKLSAGPPHGYGPPPQKPPSYGGRPSLLSSASSQSSTSTSSNSNYGQFLSSLLSAYSLGGLKPSSSGKPSSSSGKSGLASYLNNLPGFDLFKGYTALSPSSYGSLLTQASGLNKYYLPNPQAAQAAKPSASKPNYNNYLGWPAELTQQQQSKPKPSGLLASSSSIVSSFDELFKSSLTGSSNKFKRPYSDATRAITNLYKKLLN